MTSTTRLISKVKILLTNEAVAGTIFVSSGVFIGSIFSYVVQIFLGRSLTVEEYGIFNSLLSVSLIIGVLTNTFITSIIKTVTELKAREQFGTLTYLYKKISFGTLLVGLFFTAAIILGASPLARFLNISDAMILVAFGIFMSTSFIRIAPYAYLQGLLRFKAFAFANVFSNALRLVVAVTAIFMGYRVGGVYVFLGMGAIISYVVYGWLLKKNFTDRSKDDLSPHYRKILIFAGPVLVVQVGMILLNNIDIILVKHYFDEYTAGLYSGLVTVGKVFLFAANTVTVVMFPQIAAAFSRKEDYVKKLFPFLYLQLFIILAGVVIFEAFPGLIVRIMFGQAYLPVVEFLPKFIIFFALYVLLNFMTLFLLAIEKTSVYLLQIPAILLQMILIAVYHGNINQVIDMNLITACVLLVGVVVYSFKNLPKKSSLPVV